MIGFVEGRVIWEDGDVVCIQTGGVGYIIRVVRPVETSEEKVAYFICHVVREDSENLYGFASLLERQIFEVLIGVSGVGPALALAALRKFSPSSLLQIVRSKDLNSLCQIPGVGKKTGERLMVDLNSKFEGKDFGDLKDVDGNEIHEVENDAYEVLLQLGFSPHDIRKALREVEESEEIDAGSIVVDALKILRAAK